MHGSLSVLLDTALCSISPLLFLTSQLPEMNGCSLNTQVGQLILLGSKIVQGV